MLQQLQLLCQFLDPGLNVILTVQKLLVESVELQEESSNFVFRFLVLVTFWVRPGDFVFHLLFRLFSSLFMSGITDSVAEGLNADSVVGGTVNGVPLGSFKVAFIFFALLLLLLEFLHFMNIQ